MVVAYALLEAETGAIEDLRATVAEIESAEAVHVVAGDVDLIARIEVEDPGAVSEVITGEIAGLDGILDTETYISMDG
ncbi:MAG: Lrp/AsnC family transcriptional regulator [Halodesulfurarchaeum sp.]